ncbi:MAG: branched-chain amino acid transport system substrate-binding protein [Acidimicrobiaceae bacterium]|jgi:ABC-type branched-subunit amino acid transport system substrate-binding protein
MNVPTAIKVGFLEDSGQFDVEPMRRAIELRIDQCNDAGGIQGRSIDLVVEQAEGAHAGLPENIVPAWRKLVLDPEVVGVIGPGIADNCLVLADVVQAAGVPTLCWPGAEECRNEWMFQFPSGSFAHESVFLARLLAQLGHERVAVLQTGTVGDKYARHFEREARLLGLAVAGSESVDVFRDDVEEEMRRLRRGQPDAALFLGMGPPTLAFARATRAMSWDVPRFSNIAMRRVTNLHRAELSDFEGVTWTDQFEPSNPVLQDMRRRYRDRHGDFPPATFLAGGGWDMATLILEGLRRAPVISRNGLRSGLELVHQIPAATGGAAAVMGFGPWDREALKGPAIFNYRHVVDQSIETRHVSIASKSTNEGSQDSWP